MRKLISAEGRPGPIKIKRPGTPRQKKIKVESELQPSIIFDPQKGDKIKLDVCTIRVHLRTPHVVYFNLTHTGLPGTISGQAKLHEWKKFLKEKAGLNNETQY